MDNALDIQTGDIICSGPESFLRVISAVVDGHKTTLTFEPLAGGKSETVEAGADDYYDVVCTAAQWEQFPEETKAAFMAAVPE